MNEYRILERQGLFYIQKKVESFSKSDTLLDWVLRLNIIGIFLLPYYLWALITETKDKAFEWETLKLPVFETLEQAKFNYLLHPIKYTTYDNQKLAFNKAIIQMFTQSTKWLLRESNFRVFRLFKAIR